MADEEIEIIDWADYRFNHDIERKGNIGRDGTNDGSRYTSFKDECKYDEEYQYTLTRVWSIMYNYQQRMESKALHSVPARRKLPKNLGQLKEIITTVDRG